MERLAPSLEDSREEGVPPPSVRSTLIEAQKSDQTPEPDLVFTKIDLVVISVVTVGRKVHRVLVDQGTSTDVMFWSTFNKLHLSPDQLRSYDGCLYGFAGDQVEV